MNRYVAFVSGLLCNLIFGVAALYAQDREEKNANWSFQTRLVMSGSSDESDPEGYIVYSAFSVEPSVRRKISKCFSMEMNVRTESHEIDYRDSVNREIPLGSVELLPFNLLFQYNLLQKEKARIYFGAGVNLTFCWEKSGTLNSDDLSPSFGPAIQLGCDLNLSKTAFLNLNAGWNGLKTDLESNDIVLATLQMDPLQIGMGIGFVF